MNGDSIANLVRLVPFAVYATRLPKDASTLWVARVEYYTGGLSTQHVIQVHQELQGDPGIVVRTEHFNSSIVYGWQGTDIQPPVHIGPNAPHWISWHPPTGALGSSTLIGSSDQGRQRFFPASDWSSKDYTLMIRVYCCA